MSASVSRFPEEILSEIFSLCDTSTALSVARTCRQFNRIVTPKIYHTVHLDPSDDKQTYVSGRSGLFERWVLKEGPPSTSTLRLRDVTNVYNVDAFLNTVKQNARLRSLVACVGYEGLDCYFFYPSDEDDITPEDSIKDLTLKNFFINLFDLLAPTLLMCWGFPIHPGLTHIAWKANSLTKIELSFRWNDPATWEVMTEQFFDDIFTLPTLLSLTMMEIVYWSMFGDTCPHVGTSSVRCLHLITSICPLDENYKPRGLRTLLSWPKALETFSIQIDNWCGSYKNDFKSVSSYDIFEVLTLQKDSLADISVYSRFGQAPPNMVNGLGDFSALKTLRLSLHLFSDNFKILLSETLPVQARIFHVLPPHFGNSALGGYISRCFHGNSSTGELHSGISTL